MAKNDITGDTLVSKATTAAYRDNWDAIWGSEAPPLYGTPACERPDVKDAQRAVMATLRKKLEENHGD